MIAEELLEAIHGVLGETAAMIAGRLFPARHPLFGDVRQCLSTRMVSFPRHGVFQRRNRHLRTARFSCGIVRERAAHGNPERSLAFLDKIAHRSQQVANETQTGE